jgi:O-antigen/teichoic acid export membrane protein
VGLLAIFLAVAQTFVDSGFVSALIQKHNSTETDYSTVFYFNIAVSVFFYLLLFFAAPLIADFYDTLSKENQQLLIDITRVSALIIVINSLSMVQSVKLTIAIDFKTKAKISLLSVIVSGIVGVVMAYYGFGVWALVTQSILYAILTTILLWIYVKWIPGIEFSWQSFKTLFAFGSKLLISGLIDKLYTNIYSLVIGKKFSANALGLYSRADQFSQFTATNITGIIGRVTFPILSTIQNDNERLRSIYRQYLRLSAFVVFPLMIALAALAASVVDVVLGDKWNGIILWLQLLCFASMWYPIHAINLNLLQVKGRSDLFLRLEIIKKIIGIAILIITIPIGITAMCIGGIAHSLIALVINTHYTGKLISIGFFKQMKDLLPSLIYSFSMGIMVFFVIKLIDNNVFKLIIGMVIGIAYYVFIAYLTKSKEYSYLLDLIKENKHIIKRKQR